jgi:hypothetical protein
VALVVFLAGLLSGYAVLGKRAEKREDAARVLAGAMARTRTAAIEAQFSQAIAASEALGAVARQNSGSIPNFQKLAADLLTLWPGLATLELQPGGITSDIAPRAGHEGAIGFNALTHPLYRSGASETMQNHDLTVSGPLPLYLGMPGIIVRTPLFQRSRDGRERFSGFVSVSMRLGEALARARLDDLAAQGYDYTLFVPPPAGQKPVILAARGHATPQDGVTQPVRIRNVEFRLAVRPSGGWDDKSTFEILVLAVLSGLAGLAAYLFFGRRQTVMSLTASEQHLIEAAAMKIQIQEDCQKAKETAAALDIDLKIAKTSLHRAESSNAELQASLDEEVRHGAVVREEAQTRLNQAKQTAAELQSRLDSCVRTAEAESQARNAEIEESRSMLEQALQKISEMQALLEAASRVQNETAAKHQAQIQKDQAAIASLQSRLEAAAIVQNEAASRMQSQKEQAAAAELQNRLLAAERNCEEVKAKFQRQLQQDRETIRELEERAESEFREKNETASKLQEKIRLAQETILSLEAQLASTSPAPSEAVKAEQSARIASDTILATVMEVVPPPPEPMPVVVSEGNPEPASEQSIKRQSGKGKHKHPANQPDLFGTLEASSAAAPIAPIPASGLQIAAETPAPPASPVPLADEPEQPAEEPPKPEIHAGDDTVPTEPGDDKKVSEKTMQTDMDLFPELPSTSASLLRKAVKQILPLLADQDPGALDCFEDNRTVFRTAFTREGFVEFERLMKSGDFATALGDLKKAVKKHGVSL